MNVDYIPVSQYKTDRIFERFSKSYDIKKKIEIEKIKIPKVYPNGIEKYKMEYFKNFTTEKWDFIYVDKNFYLTDGIHKLTFAKNNGIKFVDVVLEKKQDIKNYLDIDLKHILANEEPNTRYSDDFLLEVAQELNLKLISKQIMKRIETNGKYLIKPKEKSRSILEIKNKLGI